MSWPLLFPLEEDEHSRGGTNFTSQGGLHRDSMFQCFSRKAVALVSLCSRLFISPRGTSGTNRALTVNARVENISVVFEGVECQVAKSCPGRKTLFSLPP